MTSGESRHEDVDASVVGLVVLEIDVHDFETFLVLDSDLSYVKERVGDVSEEIGCIVDYLRGGFVKIFAEFSPEAVEHEFGGGFASGIFGDESWIEVDVFFLLVLSDVMLFGFGFVGPTRVPCRFLLDFKPRVHVICEETFFRWFGGKCHTSRILTMRYPTSTALTSSGVLQVPRNYRCSGVCEQR